MSEWHVDEPVLETERLSLRHFCESDLDAWAAMVSDEEVMRYVGGSTLDRDQAWRSIGYVLGHWKIRGYGLWAVEERATGALVGRIGLYRPEGWPGLEVGWLVARERWGEGIATEGAAAAMRYGFETVGAERLISVIMPGNHASIRVARKLGEHLDGRVQVQGHDACVYAVDRSHWVAHGL